MPGTRTGRLMGAVIGGVLLVGGIVAAVFVDWKHEPEPPPALIRPVKSMVIGASQLTAGRQYPGRVRATEQATLAFSVSGTLIELPVRKGQEVRRGDLLARLDPRDFQNELNARQAQLDKAASDLQKLQKLAEAGAATPREVTDAKAQFDVAQAQVEIARKALEDTRLLAPFDGLIANTYVDNFQSVQAKQDILTLQDVRGITIDASVPEQRIIIAQRDREPLRYRFRAVFDFLPDREFDVTFREATAEADPATQAYRVSFDMAAPQDVTLLPGMTASIREYLIDGAVVDDPDAGFAVPLSAAPVDGQGRYFVWKLIEGDGEHLTVRRQDVEVGAMMADQVVIRRGLSAGDRIATAGVRLLTEGQRVRLYVPRADSRVSAETSRP